MVAPSGSGRTRTDTAETVFTWGIFAYVVVRAVPIWRGLEEGRVNPWIFLGLDLATAYPYAKSWPRLFRSVVARRFDRALGWSLVLLGSLLLPYIYVAVVGEDIATWVWAVLAVFLVLAAIGAAIRVVGVVGEHRS